MPLFIVSIPIGNPDDITLRAIKTLQSVDFIVCEEAKIGRKLLKQLNVEKSLYQINEHNEEESSDEIMQLLLNNQSAAYFSDAGTPLFADPGTYLVNRCHECGIQVIPVPGASSLTAALSVAGIDINRFFYAGFLPRVPIERRAAIRKLKQFDCPIIIYDTPYRLQSLLDDIKHEFPLHVSAILLLSLTKSDECILKGTLADILAQVKKSQSKREFVLIIEPPKNIRSSDNKKESFKRRKYNKRQETS
ncbi:MAG: 16S rRNA (cytidine(1402)-2'-O)-methyltransferase [SAR324 cluster bacterium]|nr:16S rRNA (cytidine(1402)-2'-O)-methyltransferase [SAR324 cluster bacterium]